MFKIIELSANFADLAMMLYVTDKFYDKKQRYNFKIVAALIILQIFFMRLTNVIFGNGSFISSAANIILYMLAMSFFYKFSVKKALMVYPLLFLSMLIIEGIISAFMNSILKADMKELLIFETFYRAAAIMIAKGLTIIFVVNATHIIKKDSIKTIKYLPLISLLLIINIALHLFMLELYTGNIEKYLDISYAVLVFFIFINAINLLSFFMILKMINYTEKEMRWNITEKEYEKQIEYFKNYNEISSEIRQLKHDLTKHIISISAYLEDGQVSEAKSYLNDLVKDYKNINAVIAIKNKIISSIVNYKIKIIDENKIDFKFYIDVPEKIHIRDVDLTVILSNIIDNAVEACQNMEQSGQREIELYINYENNNLIISETNSYKGILLYEGDKIQTKKPDKYNHGFGIENIKKTVKKYNGSCVITAQDNKFTITISM